MILSKLIIEPVDPTGEEALALSAALWSEIQARYGFVASDPYDPSTFATPGSAFWVARRDREVAGSVALAHSPTGDVAELDVMYVAPRHRRAGVASALLAHALAHARSAGVGRIQLRAGSPQPEALALYRGVGFEPIEPFGRWVDDPTALCFAMSVAHQDSP